MAYNMDATAYGYEFRGIREYTNKETGKVSRRMLVEDSNGYSSDVSVPDELVSSVYKLVKGDIVTLPCRFISTAKYSFITLTGAPEVTGNAYKGGE